MLSVRILEYLGLKLKDISMKSFEEMSEHEEETIQMIDLINVS